MTPKTTVDAAIKLCESFVNGESHFYPNTCEAIKTLLTALDEARKDAERLDWMDKNKELIGIGSFHIHARLHTTKDMPSLRQAIDAMKERGK